MSSHRKASAYSELQESWSRWQMQGLDDPVVAPEPEEPEFVPPTPEELQRDLENQRSQAQEEGHTQGYQAGYNQATLLVWQQARKVAMPRAMKPEWRLEWPRHKNRLTSTSRNLSP